MKNIITTLLLLFSTLIYSQDLNLKGTVLEKDTNLALAGATIQIIGNESGVKHPSPPEGPFLYKFDLPSNLF